MRRYLFIGLIYCIAVGAVRAQERCPIIPQPAHAERHTGYFSLDKHTPIVVEDPVAAPAAHFLQREMLRLMTTPLAVHADEGSLPAIRIGIDPSVKGEEAYTLQVTAEGIRVAASTLAGLRYGIVSMLQLAQGEATPTAVLKIPAWELADNPRYAWRGLMLDESRHFFGKAKVKSILDWMAYYKLNRFHWHLTDEPAWRLEIKQYPLLTLIGGIGSFTDGTAPAAYYTQEDIQEIVAYAAERNIVVIPEIDMPGHATAANRAYPEYSGGGTEAHPHFTFNPGKEATYAYLTDILRETNSLFPSQLLHLGGDEVSFGSAAWQSDTAIQDLMAREGLKTNQDVERYFMKRMADSVYRLNAKLLAWDEMADAGLPTDNTIIFWWRQDKPAQLKTAWANGYQTIICPRLPLYFDFVQDSTHRFGRRWDGTFNPLEAVYTYEVDGLTSTAAERDLILGVQANVWSEPIPNGQRLDFLLFPRIAALAEIAWTPDEKKAFEPFSLLLKEHLALYRQHGIYYYDPFQPNANPEPVVYRIDRDLSVERR
ncbi:beta-N-acetylhexosaminidase [Parapedobacter lycopersici]|uniref:beta-N-acetylhexosaminidase n=1 Tax=Parapedobacter lycopersici TaxID=1864939 RepID=UPI00214D99F6|nr:beta-N-acetylhexosaminidase [Parapedobacter lycopersici]